LVPHLLISKKNRLVGQVASIAASNPEESNLPEVYSELEISYKLMKKIVGSTKNEKVTPFEKQEKISLHSQFSANQIIGEIIALRGKSLLKVKLLNKPLCVELNSRVALSKRVGISSNARWRLCGIGTINSGKVCPLTSDK